MHESINKMEKLRRFIFNLSGSSILGRTFVTDVIKIESTRLAG